MIIKRFKEVFTIENLLEAYYTVRKGKKFRDLSIRYHMNLHKNLQHLLERLENGTYHLDRVSIFKVYEPKERDVVADFFEDKIVQDVICKKVLRVVLMPKFIHDNYASQPMKGTHHGVKRMKHFMMSYVNENDFQPDGWVVAGDISKFFYSINHEICKKLLRKLPIDQKILDILFLQIDICTSTLNPYADDDEDDIGLCIGFQCSQWLSNMYLDPLDHYVKEVLRVKYYGRYADDFVMICNTKEEATKNLHMVSEFVSRELDLSLNKKSYVHPFSQGICFLGYHMTYNENSREIDMAIRNKSIARMERRTRTLLHLIKKGEVTIESANASVESWYSYAKHGETAKVAYAYTWAKLKLMEAADDQAFSNMVDAKYKTEDPMGLVDDEGFYHLIRRTEPYHEEIDFKLAQRNYQAMASFFDRGRYKSVSISNKTDAARDRIRKSI